MIFCDISPMSLENYNLLVKTVAANEELAISA